MYGAGRVKNILHIVLVVYSRNYNIKTTIASLNVMYISTNRIFVSNFELFEKLPKTLNRNFVSLTLDVDTII